jgi:hypothetical protein
MQNLSGTHEQKLERCVMIIYNYFAYFVHNNCFDKGLVKKRSYQELKGRRRSKLPKVKSQKFEQSFAED